MIGAHANCTITHCDNDWIRQALRQDEHQKVQRADDLQATTVRKDLGKDARMLKTDNPPISRA